jgi:hypothetical protein
MQNISIATTANVNEDRIYQADKFFSVQQQERLKKLMSDWRVARDRGDSLPSEQQSELDNLIETELSATAERAQAILAQKSLLTQL